MGRWQCLDAVNAASYPRAGRCLTNSGGGYYSPHGGLILAALIVGAAMLMRVETTFRIWGYPGLAIIFFLVAAGGGITLLINILFYAKSGHE